MTTNDTIVRCGRLSLKLGLAMLTDVAPERFARLAAPGGTTVTSNHACFVFGHLSLYWGWVCAMAGDEAGATEAAAPEAWKPLFDMGATCVDDADGTVYPPMSEVVAQYQKGAERAFQAIANATPETLAAPNPNDQMREMTGLETIADVLQFMVTLHTTMHLGQVSAWRRMEGLGPAMPF